MKFVISDSERKQELKVEIHSVSFDINEKCFYFIYETHNHYARDFNPINLTFVYDTVHISFKDETEVKVFKDWLIEQNEKCLMSWK